MSVLNINYVFVLEQHFYGFFLNLLPIFNQQSKQFKNENFQHIS